MRAHYILETCLYGTDLQSMEKFYKEVLGLQLVSKSEGRHVFFRCGNSMVLLFNPEETQRADQDVPPHGYTGKGHLAFGVPLKELAQWVEHLERNHVSIEARVEWPSGGSSLYFRDPAGNSVEITTPQIWGISEKVLSG
ncbi:MAG: glyoxalase/bleomycin resistance/extradiol dioxygenase family protein [Calditrichaeota bacterium]|nr:MAG: glyoxalase/bleomycin resistance/extradiol dioxygenase family protein [Calditrichota bacterium]